MIPPYDSVVNRENTLVEDSYKSIEYPYDVSRSICYNSSGGKIMKTTIENPMGTEPILPLLAKMSVPVIFSMLISSLYNLVDSYFVAQISEKALRAVSLSYPIQLIIIAFGVGTGVGVNAYAARLLGEKKNEQASNVASHGLVLILFTSLAFMIFSTLGIETLFATFTKDPEVFTMGVSYSRLVTFFSIGSLVQISQEKTIQSTGRMFVPMLSQLVGSVINIVLDPIFIFGHFGIPAMGVTGAAVATLIGQFVGAFICMHYLLIYDGELKITPKHYRFDWAIVKRIYRVGFPSILMQSIGAFLNMGFNYILAPISEIAVSVLGIYYKLESFVVLPVFGLTQGVLPLIAYNYGARNKHRITGAMHYGIRIALGMMITGAALMILLPKQLLLIFNSTPDMLEIGIPMLRIIALCFIPAAVGIMFSTFFQALGFGLYSLQMSILRQVVIILPLAKALSFIGIKAIWTAFPIAEIVSLAYGYYLYKMILRENVMSL